MIAMLTFSAAAAALVWFAGRTDAARDPRLTTTALALLAIFPLLLLAMPKLEILPPRPAGGATAVTGLDWSALALAGWCLVSLFGLARLALAAREIHRWRRRSELLERREDIEIRRLAGLHGPVAAGVFRRVVFVPESWSAWSETERAIILEHELAHHRRRDPLRRWIAELACAVHAWNPLVLWMTRRLCEQCEVACDVAVINKGTPPRDYARLLCSVAERQPHRLPVLAMADAAGLESRVRRLMQPRRPAGLLPIVAMILATAGIAAALSMSSRAPAEERIPPEEVELRWSAEAFPAD